MYRLIAKKPDATGSGVSNVYMKYVAARGLSECEDVTDSDMDKIELASFMQKVLRQRVCSKYSEDSKTSACKCGRDKSWHSERKLEVTSEESSDTWKPYTHTDTEPCTTFGQIQFSGFGNDSYDNRSMYARVDHRTRPERLWTLMTRYWRLEPPKMVISVTGGAQLFLKARHRESLKQGLIKATANTGAWIITGGTNKGVMALVGEAVSEYSTMARAENKKLVCIGIATWGAIKNNSCLESKSGGKFPAVYALDKADDVALDSNHTHFIFADNGCIKPDSFGADIKLRSERIIPTVLVVVGGGPNTLLTIKEALCPSHGHPIPVVIIDGSGRAANVLSRAITMDHTRYDFQATLKQQVAHYYDIDAHAGDGKTSFEHIQTIVSSPNRGLIHTVKLDNEEGSKDIDKAILRVLLKAQQADVETQLRLSLAWNRPDIAREEIFEDPKREKITSDILKKLRLKVLVRNCTEFVQLLMDYGVQFDKDFTVKELAKLYEKMISQKRSEKTNIAASLFKQLKESLELSNAVKKSSVLLAVGSILDDLLGGEFKFFQYYQVLVTKLAVERKLPMITTQPPDTYRDLFLWAVLFNRRDMAMLFWRAGKQHIGSALIAAALYNKLSSITYDEQQTDLSKQLNENAECFQTLAKSVLDECFKRKSVMARVLLVRPLDLWDSKTVLDIARSAELMDFMSQTACQTKLNNIWRGKLTPLTNNLQIILALLFPPFIWCLDFEKTDMDQEFVMCQRNLISAQNNNKYTTLSKLHSPTANTNVNSVKARWEIFKNVNKKNIRNTLTSIDCYCQLLLEKPRQFYASPMIKFCYDCITQIMYIGLFSYFVLDHLEPLQPDTVIEVQSLPSIELVIWLWTLLVLLDTTVKQRKRRLHTSSDMPVHALVLYYTILMLNHFSSIARYLVFFASVVLRLMNLQGDAFVSTRICYCISLSLFYVKFMRLFYVDRNIGPKVVIIRQMLKDLIFFGLIWVVFLLAYGITVESIQYRNDENAWERLERVIYTSYWMVFTQFDDAARLGVYGCGNASAPGNVINNLEQCDMRTSIYLKFACAVYCLLTVVLLLNILTAVFSNTINLIHDKSEVIWRFLRYELISNYLDSGYPPPLSLIHYSVNLVHWCKSHWADAYQHHGSSLRYVISTSGTDNVGDYVLTKEQNEYLTSFEKTSMEDYVRGSRHDEESQLDAIVGNISHRMQEMVNKVELLTEQVTHIDEKADRYFVGLSEKLLEQQRQIQTQQHHISDMLTLIKSLTVQQQLPTGSN